MEKLSNDIMNKLKKGEIIGWSKKVPHSGRTIKVSKEEFIQKTTKIEGEE